MILRGITEDSAVAIATAVIGACALLAAAVLALIGVVIAQRRDVKVIREQVTNDHETNLRTEGDQRHDQNSRRLGALEAGQKVLMKGMGRIEDHLGIEHTIPRPPRRRTR